MAEIRSMAYARRVGMQCEAYVYMRYIYTTLSFFLYNRPCYATIAHTSGKRDLLPYSRLPYVRDTTGIPLPNPPFSTVYAITPRHSRVNADTHCFSVETPVDDFANTAEDLRHRGDHHQSIPVLHVYSTCLLVFTCLYASGGWCDLCPLHFGAVLRFSTQLSCN